MDPVVILTDTRLQVEPGEQAQTTATVRNAGDIVEEYRLELLGEAATWVEVVPAELSVLPGDEQRVQIVFRPPRDGSAPAGEVPFGFRCVSMEDPDSVAVVEGDLTVGPVLDLDAQLVPAARRGRWSSGFRVQLENRGSVPLQLRLAVSDPGQALSFALAPSLLEVPPRGRAEATLKVRTRSPVLRGQLQRHTFQVGYQRLAAAPGDGGGAGQLDGAFEQLPIVSKGLLTLAVVAVAAAVAAFILLHPKRGPEGEGLPPATPTLQKVTAVGSDRVRLVWEPDSNATGYEVEKLGTASAGSPVAVEDVAKDIPKAQNAFTWDGLAPGQEHCFRLAAVNDVGRSDPTDRSCVKTLEAARFDPPSGVLATAEGNQIRVRWRPNEAAEHLVLLDGAKAEQAPAGVSSILVPAQPGERCVSVLAVRDEAASKPSDERCVNVGDPLPGGGTTGPPIVGITPGDTRGWFALLEIHSRDRQAEAIRRREQLEQQLGVPVKLLDSRQVAHIEGDELGVLAIVVDGYGSESEALTFCRQHPELPCEVR